MKSIKTLKVFSLIIFFVALYLPIYTAVISAFGVSGTVSINIRNLGLSTIMQITIFVTVLLGLFGSFVRPSLSKITNIVVVVIFALQIGLLIIAKDAATNYGLGFLTMILMLVTYGVSSFAPELADKGYQSVGSLLQKLGGLIVDTIGESEQVPPEITQEERAEQ